MRHIVAMAVVLALPSAGTAWAEQHLVSPDLAQQRLSEARASREHDVQVVDRALATPQAATAARALGADVEKLRAAVPTLSDQELSEVASRAAALGNDPVSGAMDPDIKLLLMVLLIVAIVVILLRAVD